MYQKLWSDDVQFLQYGAQQTDGQMDGQTDSQKKWYIEVGAPPKNIRLQINASLEVIAPKNGGAVCFTKLFE